MPMDFVEKNLSKSRAAAAESFPLIVLFIDQWPMDGRTDGWTDGRQTYIPCTVVNRRPFFIVCLLSIRRQCAMLCCSLCCTRIDPSVSVCVCRRSARAVRWGCIIHVEVVQRPALISPSLSPSNRHTRVCVCGKGGRNTAVKVKRKKRTVEQGSIKVTVYCLSYRGHSSLSRELLLFLHSNSRDQVLQHAIATRVARRRRRRRRRQYWIIIMHWRPNYQVTTLFRF